MMWESPVSQTGRCVWVQQFSGCVETLWNSPAPEVWTDGFGGAHRKGFRGSVVLMFTDSWVNHWGTCHRQDQRHRGHGKIKISVCLCVLVMWRAKCSLYSPHVCHVLTIEQQASIIQNYDLSKWAHHWKCFQLTNKLQSRAIWGGISIPN